MSCKDFRLNLFLYFSEELSGKDLEVFESHQNSCSECKNHFMEYQNISEKYMEIPQYTLTDFQKENIKTNINRLANERSVLRYSKYVVAAAAILLISISTYFNLINKDDFDAMAVFEQEKIKSTSTIKAFELLPNIDREESLFDSITDQIEKLESSSFDIVFSFEDNPRLEKIKKRIDKIKNDDFFRSES